MTGTMTARSEEDNLSMLSCIRKQAELLLTSRCFVRFAQHVERNKLRKHLGRCATMLKHSAVRKLVITHFLRWFYRTRRRSAPCLGMEGLPRIVVFSSNQDFLNLGVRYFRRWRHWLRQIRQRRCTNTELLDSKTADRQLHHSFLQWRCFVCQRREERLVKRVEQLTYQNGKLLGEIKRMEQHCEGSLEREEALKSLLTSMEEHRNRQFKELECYRRAVCDAVNLLHVVSGGENNARGSSRSSTMGQQMSFASGEHEETLQLLLRAAKVVHGVVEKLRRALPADSGMAETLDTAVDSVCQHVAKLDGVLDELMEELHGSSSLTAYMRDCMRATAENITAISQKCPPPNLFAIHKEKPAGIIMRKGSRESQESNGLEASFVDWEALNALKDQLAHGDTLSTGVPATAAVLESVDEALKCLYDRQHSDDELVGNHRKETACSKEQVHVLAEAAGQAIRLMQNSCSMTTQHQRGVAANTKEELTGVKVCELAAILRYETEVASDALSKIRHVLLNSRPLPKMSAHDTDVRPYAKGSTSTETSQFVSYSGLVKMVQALDEQRKEAIEAYDTMHSGMQQLVSEFLTVESERGSCTSVSSESCSEGRLNSAEKAQLSALHHTSGCPYGLMEGVESILHALRTCINSRDLEIEELQNVIRRSAAALCSDGAVRPDGHINADEDVNSSEISFSEGNRLLLMCTEVGKAVAVAKSTMKLANSGSVCVPDIVVELQGKVEALHAVEDECMTLFRGLQDAGICCDSEPFADSNSGATTSQTVGAAAGGDADVAVLCRRVMRIVLHDVRRVSQEFLRLRTVCRELLDVLEGDGQDTRGTLVPAHEEGIVHSLARHTTELRRALSSHPVVTGDKGSWKGSVSDRMAMLISKVALLQCEREALNGEVMQTSERHSSHVRVLIRESDQLKRYNQRLQDEVEKLREHQGSMGLLVNRRMVCVERLLEKEAPRVLRGRWFMLWMTSVCMRQRKAALDAREAEEAISLQMARRQHQQNIAIGQLTALLNSLPPVDRCKPQVPVSELQLLHLIQSENYETFRELVRRRQSAIGTWRRSLQTLLPGASALRKEVVLLREEITGKWKRQLEGLLHELSHGIHTVFNILNERQSEEDVALRKRASRGETCLRKNKELKKRNTALLKEMEELRRRVSTQDGRIIKLERESREIQLSCLLTDNDSSTPIVESRKEGLHHSIFAPDVQLRDQEQAERLMISGAKRLAVEAITAIAGSDSVGHIAEVAELTLELYNRTAESLEVICNAHPVAQHDFLQVAEICLRDLQTLREVRHEIVMRLPELLRAPYID